METKSKVLWALEGAHGEMRRAAVRAAAVPDVTPELLRDVAHELNEAAGNHRGYEFDDVRTRDRLRCQAKAARMAADLL